MNTIIDIKEETQIGNIVLEVGDKIKIIQEVTSSITPLLVKQYNEELKSALIYKQLENKAKFKGYTGLTHYFHEASEEEFEHAEEFKKMVEDLQEYPNITFDIEDSTPFEFKELIEYALDHEKFITKSLNTILETAKLQKENSVINFLSKYVEEQIDEEAKYFDILTRVSLTDSLEGILLIDRELLKEE